MRGGFFDKNNNEVEAFEKKVTERLEKQSLEIRIEEAFFIYGGTYDERCAHCEKIRSQYPHLPHFSQSDYENPGEAILLLTDKSLWSGQTGNYIRDLAQRQNHVYPCEVAQTAFQSLDRPPSP